MFNGKMLVSKVSRETHDTVTLALKPEQGDIDFKPGQFVMIELLNQAEKVPKRAYSISSSPSKKGFIEITVKMMPGGKVSTLLNGVKEGVEFNVMGPYGHFVFDPEKMNEIVLFGAGSGIAPFRCFCDYIIDKKLSTKVVFVYSNKAEEDIIFHKQLAQLPEKIKGLELILALSREEKPGFRFGRIDGPLVKEIVAKNAKANFFICGPPAMVEGTKKLLEENGVAKEQVKVEVYG